MMNRPLEATPLETGFAYLRWEAVDAHLAGDGIRVLHLCTVALERVRKNHRNAANKTPLSQSRWALYFGLYWMLDDGLRFLIDSVIDEDKIEIDDVSKWDLILINFLRTTIHIPVNFASTDELKLGPKEWVEARSHLAEDAAALTLALEISWYEDPSSDVWVELAHAWLNKCPETCLLRTEIDRTIERLRLQSKFCTLGVLPDGNSVPGGLTPEQKDLIRVWCLYYEARFSELHTLLVELAARIRLDSPLYPAFFRAIHFSRVPRESKESQFLSLSRRQYVESRQPSQACQHLRDERYGSNFADIARAGFPDGVASERFTCLRMAMLNQLHALRSWDIGAWMKGELQRAHSWLELGSRRDSQAAKIGILALKNALSVPKPGKYPHFDRSIQLLDTLSDDERRDIARNLISTPRIAWGDACAILERLSDAIPADVLREVAEWSGKLDLDDHHGRWTRTHLEWWGKMLYWCPNAEDLIEILKPAINVKAANPACWEPLFGVFCAAIIKGKQDTALGVLNTLLEVKNDKPHFENRFNILEMVVRHRPDFAETARAWLQTHVEQRQDPFESFLLRHIDEPIGVPIDDTEMRDWLIGELGRSCEKRLAEKEGSVSIPTKLFHGMMLTISWPSFESDLVQKLIAVIDADYVPFANKTDPIACLAVLASIYGSDDAEPITTAALRWLKQGIQGRDLGFTGPLSTAQISGFGSSAIDDAFSFLIDVLAEKHFDQVGERLTSWLFINAVRRPTNIIQRTLSATLKSSINCQEPSVSMSLVGIAEAIAAAGFSKTPREVIQGFYDAALSESNAARVRKWLATEAGRWCIELWSNRLDEVSQIADPTVRAAAATAINLWKKLELPMSPALQEVYERLKNDCRFRVQFALAYSGEQ